MPLRVSCYALLSQASKRLTLSSIYQNFCLRNKNRNSRPSLLPGFQSRLKPQDLLAEKHTSSSAAPSLLALPTEDPLVPFSNTPVPSAVPMLPSTAAGIFGSTGDVFSAYASLSNVLSPQQLQEFLITLTKPGQGELRSQVTTTCSHAPSIHACQKLQSLKLAKSFSA